ncbi:uncharacterized protein cracdla [Pagrus major]|uniref:uncharacterized protein cracdla n=1 Tax=Pagrus major TaxID=143350 RepID=UPI003CC84ECE
MESFCGDTEESTEDIAGRKKSKLKSLKTRLFGRSKRAGAEEDVKLSQSASDITAGKDLGSEEDLTCPQGMMGSRALSHDSIFQADEVLTEAEPARVLSQENVHSKIKALQMKLQLQKLHLGPPPLVLPVRRPEDQESRSEDDSHPHSPSEISRGDVTMQGTLSKTMPQPFTRALSPNHKPAPTKSATPSHPLPPSVSSNSSVVEPPLDFSSPAQSTPCLDSSFARHRMSVKPRNQRASTKKRLTTTDSRSHLNNIDHPESMTEEEQPLNTQEEVTLETEQEGAVIKSERVPSKSPEVVQITPEAATRSSSQTFPQQDQAVPGRVHSLPPQILRVKPHRPADVRPSERPHSSFIPSEVKDKREAGLEIQTMSHDKRNTPNKAGMTEASSDQLSNALSSAVALRSSSAHQSDETESMRAIKRPAAGAGSFHFSITTAKNRDGERPRSGSFVGVLEKIEARHKMEEKPFSSMKEKAELRDSQPRGGSFAVGRLRQEGAAHKSSVVPWDKRDSFKKVETVTPSKNVTTDTGAAEEKEVESSQELVEEAVEAREVEEDEGKTAFGIKLRSTSQSIRFRSDASSNQTSKSPVCEEQSEQQKRQEMSDNAGNMSKKLSNISSTPSTGGDPQLADRAPSGFSIPVKHNPPSTCDPHIKPTDAQTTSLNPKEVETAHVEPQPGPQVAPQTAPSEVSWMSLAMEKTRSLQQLFTSRFPRDFTGTQAVARPQAQAQTTNQTETPTAAQIQTQSVKIQRSTTPPEAANQPSADAVKAESRSQAHTVKPSLVLVQQKTSTTSPIQSNTSREAQPSKQSHPTTTQFASQSVQTNPWTTQSPVHSSLTETSSQSAQGSITQSLAQSYLSSGQLQQQQQQQQQQQPPWSSRGGLHSTNQLKSTTSASAPASSAAPVSTSSSATPPPPLVSVLGRGEREATVQEKEGALLSGRRPVWAGSVSERAAFLEKQAESTTTPGTKGVDVKKAQTEAQTSGESPAPAKTTPLNKDTKQEGRQGDKPAESSPTKVPDRPREDKWLRKNVQPSSSPSSSPPMSDSGQPSWMELAKRKSMAWSDKSME